MQNKTPVKIYYLKNNKTINHLSQKNYQSDSIFPQKKLRSFFFSDKKNENKQKVSSITHLSSVLQIQKDNSHSYLNNNNFFSTELLEDQNQKVKTNHNKESLNLQTFTNLTQFFRKQDFSEKLFYQNNLEEKKKKQKNLAFIIREKWSQNHIQKQLRKTQKNIKRTLQLSKSPQNANNQVVQRSKSLVHKFHSKSQTKNILKSQFFDFATSKTNFYKEKKERKPIQKQNVTQSICLKKQQFSFHNIKSKNQSFQSKRFKKETQSVFKQAEDIQIKRAKTNQNIRESRKYKKIKRILNLINDEQIQKKWWSKNQPKSKVFQLRRTLVH